MMSPERLPGYSDRVSLPKPPEALRLLPWETCFVLSSSGYNKFLRIGRSRRCMYRGCIATGLVSDSGFILLPRVR